MDPESMLRSSNMADRILEVSDDCHTVCMDTKKVECPCEAPILLENWLPTQKALDGIAAAARASMRAWAVSSPTKPLTSPDIVPDGWVSHKGPQGQIYWHHTTLGPAPWEHTTPEEDCNNIGLPSPEEAPEDWVSHRCPFTGRTFWHHEALGPSPWEAMRRNLQKEEERIDSTESWSGFNCIVVQQPCPFHSKVNRR